MASSASTSSTFERVDIRTSEPFLGLCYRAWKRLIANVVDVGSTRPRDDSPRQLAREAILRCPARASWSIEVPWWPPSTRHSAAIPQGRRKRAHRPPPPAPHRRLPTSPPIGQRSDAGCSTLRRDPRRRRRHVRSIAAARVVARPRPGHQFANLGEFVGTEWPVLKCLGIVSGLFDGSRAGDRDEMG